MNRLLKRLVPIVTLAVALAWIYFGVYVYGVWDARRGPLGGFFPVMVAALLLVVSIVAILQADREKLPVFKADSFKLIAAVVSIFALTFVIGMLPTLLVFLVVWLRVVERYPWRTTLTVTAVITAIVSGVFVFWLGVNFPKGILFDALIGR